MPQRSCPTNLEGQASEDQIVAHTAEAALRSTSSAEISKLLLQRALEMTGSAFGCVAFSDPQSGALVCAAADCEGWCRDLGEQDAVVLINDAAAHPRWQRIRPVHGALRRLILVPAIDRGRCAGRLLVANAPGDYTVPDLQFLERLAGVLAVAARRMTEGTRRSTDGPQPQRRILVAEDNKANRKIAVTMLERAGYFADAVSDGGQAVAALKACRYDLVLMDVQMPEMDGFHATQEIRRLEAATRHTPIVAMVTNAPGGDRQRCLAAGMDDYISKPVRLEELRETVRRWARTAHSA